MKLNNWFSAGAVALIFCAMPITQAISQTTVFSDDFNSGVIDANKWTTSGNTVVESGGVMQVLTTVTDQGGVLTSVPVPISPHGDITITRSAFLHYANEYFVGDMLVKFGSLGWAGVNYANYFYPSTYYGWEDRYGIYLSRNNVGGWPPFINSSSDTDISEPFSPIWDTWFNEKLVYSPDTGNLQYFINGQQMADYFIGVMPATSNPTIQFQFRAWGWWTGHAQLFDNLLVTQESSQPSCQLNVTGFHQGDGLPNVPTTFGPGNGFNTRDFGCALCSSAAMLTSIPGLENMTPFTLNELLLNPTVNGYTKQGDLIWGNLQKAKTGVIYKVEDSYDSYFSMAQITDYLKEHMCNRDQRVILHLQETKNGIAAGPHFILVTKKDGSDWQVFDPGWSSSSPSDALSSLQSHLDGFTTTFDGAFRKFKIEGVRTYAESGNPASITIIGHSPIDLLVISPSGKLLGYDAGTNILEVPDGSYFRDFPIADDNGDAPSVGDPTGIVTACIPSPTNGEYHVQVTGTALGTYSLDFESVGTNGNVSEATVFGVTDTGVETSYTMTYNSSTNGTLTTPRHVVTVSDIIEEVIACRNLGLIDNDGIAISLIQKLIAANKVSVANNNTAAQNILNAFANEVSAQTSKHIQSDAANLLIGDARSLQ